MSGYLTLSILPEMIVYTENKLFISLAYKISLLVGTTKKRLIKVFFWLQLYLIFTLKRVCDIMIIWLNLKKFLFNMWMSFIRFMISVMRLILTLFLLVISFPAQLPLCEHFQKLTKTTKAIFLLMISTWKILKTRI